VRRSGPTNGALAVYYHVDGTASNGVDYAELPGMVTIPAGHRAVEFKVVPIDDRLPERLETVVLRLRVPPDLTSNVPPYLVGYRGRAAVTTVPDGAIHFVDPDADEATQRYYRAVPEANPPAE
jgi:hypothetical protein